MLNVVKYICLSALKLTENSCGPLFSITVFFNIQLCIKKELHSFMKYIKLKLKNKI